MRNQILSLVDRGSSIKDKLINSNQLSEYFVRKSLQDALISSAEVS